MSIKLNTYDYGDIDISHAKAQGSEKFIDLSHSKDRYFMCGVERCGNDMFFKKHDDSTYTCPSCYIKYEFKVVKS